MSEPVFNTPVFIQEMNETSVDIVDAPFFYNNAGQPAYMRRDQLPSSATILTAAGSDPALALGNEYAVPEIIGVKQTPPWGVETQLGLAGQEIEYPPMWATREVAAAFGITLVEPGQAVEITSPVKILQQIEYEYGVFAGHWSPYQNTGMNLLSVVCTDLEHHDFPHVFASTDPQFPLVISVGRYWPAQKKIRVADLWVPRGSALYIPPMPALPGAECIDLHNNRNSARACWGDIHQNTLVTHTLLQNKGGFFYWFWNAKPTVHSHLSHR
ncbi:hypothetical protein [Silvimonas iriomotensis]|uniref:Uncharacterized protein n=1 Tax=Silvimonas iriomotensis TaxID=449662 RepID=A0ABQ2PEJ0_9NEIS|nr:hypothetical protein [Silvimonas iriomotensis]GGP23801.1 hypothetical protein GCM10010970_38010 [Silvimonas iriomotensis]